jgi:hypothetical protein
MHGGFLVWPLRVGVVECRDRDKVKEREFWYKWLNDCATEYLTVFGSRRACSMGK